MNATPDNLEVEVKFHIDDPEKMRARLMGLAIPYQAEVFETNLRFEDPGHSLHANDKLLRLRKDNGCRLTYKSKPDMSDSQCKVYKELEVTVSDFDVMRGILTSLGFHTAQVYEKRRQTFTWNDVEICLDVMPYGTFLEIEGQEESIKRTARELEFPWEKRILSNYLAMFEALRTHYALAFRDVTFDNFARHPADITPLLPSFEVGD